MSRIRTVKPEFWTSEQIMECSPLARLAFIGMWNFCDDNGVHPASCKTLKAQIFPADDLTAADVQSLINELLQQRLLIEFIAENRPWWWVTGWHHQLINRPSKSRFPLPPHHALNTKAPNHDVEQPAATTQGILTESSVSVHGVLIERSLTEGKGREKEKEGKGKGKEEAAPAPCASLPVSPVIVSPATETTTPKPKAVKAPKPAKTIKAQIPQDWTPAETTYALLEKQGIDRPFAESCIDEFRLYWQERGESRHGWESTFVNNVKRQWEHRPATKQNPPRNGERYAPPSRAMSPEVAEFDDILRNLNTKNLKPVIEGECSHVAH